MVLATDQTNKMGNCCKRSKQRQVRGLSQSPVIGAPRVLYENVDEFTAALTRALAKIVREQTASEYAK